MERFRHLPGGLKRTEQDGYLMIEAFGLALPDLAAATRVWLPHVRYRTGLDFMKSRWEG